MPPMYNTTKNSYYLKAGVYEVFGNSCKESILENNFKQPTHNAKCAPQEDLGKYVWFKSGRYNREDLKNLEEHPGSFSVCEGDKSGRFILSLRTSQIYKSAAKIVSYKIKWSPQGYHIKVIYKFKSLQ